MAVFRLPLASLALAAACLVLIACEQKSPEEKVADLRSRYTVEVNQSGFVATPRYPEPEVMAEGEEGEEAAAGEEASAAEGAGDEGELAAAVEPEPEGYDILLDLIVATSGRETLPRLTIDVVHLDSAESEKNRWPVTLDTSRIIRGPGVQITQALENVDYVEGDIFYAEVRADVPPAERASYPEFSSVP